METMKDLWIFSFLLFRIVTSCTTKVPTVACNPKQFDCGLNVCIAGEKWCDGVVHCQSGFDEANCPLEKGKFRLDGSSDVEGIVTYNGSPICSRTWNKRNAQVFCRQLSPNDDVTAFHQIGLDAGVDFPAIGVHAFQNLEFDCQGNEIDLNECKHKLLPKACNTNDLAGVNCMSKSINLQSDGKLAIGGTPVCDTKWTEKKSDFICSKIMGPGSQSISTDYMQLDAEKTVGLACQEFASTYEDCELNITRGSCNAKQPVIACSACNSSVIVERIKQLSEIQKSATNTIDDMMNAIMQLKEWLNLDCKINCNKDRHYTLGVTYLREQENLPCLLDLALEKVQKEYNESLPTKPNAVDVGYDWAKLMQLRSDSQRYKASYEAVENVSYVTADFDEEFLDALEFWSYIDSDPKFEADWQKTLSEITTKLEDTKTEGERLCYRVRDFASVSSCKRRVKNLCETNQKFINHMNETREMKMQSGHREPISPEGRRILKEKEKIIKDQMNKLKTESRKKKRDNFEQRIKRLHNNIQGRIMREESLSNACLLYEYLNGGKPVRQCQDANSNALPTFYSPLQKYPMCGSRELRKRKVIIPSRLESEGEEMEKGTINLSQLLDVKDWRANMNASYIEGRTQFQIPDADWLVKYGWISEEERDKGPFFIREFLIFPLPFDEDYSTRFNIWTKESPIGDKVYSMDDDNSFGSFVFGTRGRSFGNKPWTNHYVTPGCPEVLPGVERNTASGFADNASPNVFSLWNIKYILDSDQVHPNIHPSGIFYLQGQIQICYGPPGSPRNLPKDEERFRPQNYPSLAKEPSKCCHDETNAYLDQASAQCLQCPEGSQSHHNGYYCQKCPPGTEPALLPVGCYPCQPGFFKAVFGNAKCEPCPASSTDQTETGSIRC